MKLKKYTDEQREWLMEKVGMSKYKTQSGRIRMSKIRNAFETKFGEKRTRQGLGFAVRTMVKPEERKEYTATNVENSLRNIESFCHNTLNEVSQIRQFNDKVKGLA